MKALVSSLLLALVALVPVTAQTTVSAREILDKINRHEPVSYQNTTITGDLDLTSLANRKEVRESRWDDGTNYLSVVDVPLTFRNCLFQGKFLAYRSENQEGHKLLRTSSTVYNTDFTEAVTLENCQFEEETAFKYSRFSQRASFTGNTFRREALFKYTNFRGDVDFSKSTFRGYADFKYTHFDEKSAFQKAAFERVADFKYTKFEEGVDFNQASFSGSTDFKYTRFPRGTNFDNTRFSGSTDFKYTTLDGRKFAPNRD